MEIPGKFNLKVAPNSYNPTGSGPGFNIIERAVFPIPVRPTIDR
jgi:hypothetical protein